MDACMHAIHTHTHTHTNVYIHTNIHMQAFMCMPFCSCCTRPTSFARMRIHVYVYVFFLLSLFLLSLSLSVLFFLLPLCANGQLANQIHVCYVHLYHKHISSAYVRIHTHRSSKHTEKLTGIASLDALSANPLKKHSSKPASCACAYVCLRFFQLLREIWFGRL